MDTHWLKTALRLGALLLALASAQAGAWWDEAWSYRMKIGVDGSKIAAPLVQVPVAVRLHSGIFPFGGSNPDGSDLRFVAADDKTALPFHIDRFDATYGIAVIWVRLPTLGGPSGTQFFWLYYGNPEAAPSQDAAGTYDPDHSLVFHFADRETNPLDSTQYGNHAQPGDIPVTPAGAIDASARLDGSGGIPVAASGSTKLTANRGFTFSAWIKPEGEQKDAVLYEQREGKRALTIALDAAGVYARIERDQGKPVETPRAPLTPGRWQHLGVIAAERLVVYLNGQEAAGGTGRLDDLGGEIRLGIDAEGRRGFAGEIDEVQLSSLARPAAWLQVATAQGPDGALLAYGEEEGGKDAGSAYLGIVKVLVDAVSPEGWVVIALIGLLGLVSLEAGLNKSVYLGRMERADRVFRGQPRALDLDGMDDADPPPAAAARDKSIRHSSLLRLHDHAMSELERILTVHEQRGHGRWLSPQGVEALRSSLDAALMNEIERMNHKLVLLTLAVSGGPFLGLFGTVVGIMITFATIAASGDVNVNTIAPGVAAALTTTVAGLMIAIPAMFGYNHLATRIRNLTHGMEVFSDELVGRIALAHALSQTPGDRSRNAPTQQG